MAANERRFQSYDVFKLIVALVLLLLLIWLLLQPSAGTPAASVTQTGAAPPTTAAPTAAAATAAPRAPTVQAEASAGQVQLTGAADPGARLEVVIDGQAAGTVTADAAGRWSFTAEADPGEREIAVNALDAAGRRLASSAPLIVNVPAPIAEPEFGVEVQAGALLVSGTGTPGAQVRVAIDGLEAGLVTAGADGRWTLTAEVAPGEHTIAVEALDAAGQVAAAAPPLRIAAPAPATAPAFEAPTGPLAAGPTTLQGTGAPGSRVQIMVDGQPAGTATVGADGRWAFEAALTAGQHEIAVNALDAAGQVAASSAEAVLTVSAAAAATPAPTVSAACRPGDPDAYGVDQGKVWLVDRCDTMSFIARQTGIDLNALIAANPQVLDPDLIYPGQLITLPGR